jgi:hypothetical protein
MWMQTLKYIILGSLGTAETLTSTGQRIASSGSELISFLDSKAGTNAGRKGGSKEARRVRNETCGKRKKVRTWLGKRG